MLGLRYDVGDRDLEREYERLRILSGEVDLDLPDLPYLSGDLPLNLDPLGGGDLERKRRLPVCPP